MTGTGRVRRSVDVIEMVTRHTGGARGIRHVAAQEGRVTTPCHSSETPPSLLRRRGGTQRVLGGRGAGVTATGSSSTESTSATGAITIGSSSRRTVSRTVSVGNASKTRTTCAGSATPFCASTCATARAVVGDNIRSAVKSAASVPVLKACPLAVCGCPCPETVIIKRVRVSRPVRLLYHGTRRGT